MLESGIFLITNVTGIFACITEDIGPNHTSEYNPIYTLMPHICLPIKSDSICPGFPALDVNPVKAITHSYCQKNARKKKKRRDWKKKKKRWRSLSYLLEVLLTDVVVN